MSSFKDHVLDPDKTSGGVRLPLFDADGNISSDYLLVRWSWDDKVRAALDELKRKGLKGIVQITPDMSAKSKSGAEATNKALQARLLLDGIVAQIAGWSFDEKPTKKNIIAFIKSRPDIAERVDIASANNKLFFGVSGKSS